MAARDPVFLGADVVDLVERAGVLLEAETAGGSESEAPVDGPTLRLDLPLHGGQPAGDASA